MKLNNPKSAGWDPKPPSHRSSIPHRMAFFFSGLWNIGPDLVIGASLAVVLPGVLIWISIYPPDVLGIFLRTVLGIIYLTALPGYSFVAFLFPRKRSLSPLERFGLCVGLSISFVGFAGYFVNGVGWGVRLETLSILLSTFCLLFFVLALVRRKRIRHEHHTVNSEERLRMRLPMMSRSTGILAVVLSVTILSAIAVVIFSAMRAGPQERYTEYYLLGADGQLLTAMSPITLGENVTVILNVVNHEQREVKYSVLIRDCGSLRLTDSFTLPDQQRWNKTYLLAPTVVGDQCNFSFQLFREGDTEPYRSLYFWMAVVPPPTESSRRKELT
jgi:uncharacterized membrane protein